MTTQAATKTVQGARRGLPQLKERHREYIAFLAFALPNLATLAIWVYWPFIFSLYLSFTNWNILRAAKQIVGFDNYLNLAQDPLFWQVTQNTVIFTIVTVFMRLALSLGLAVLLNQQLLGRALWRLVIFSPHITTSAAIALVWLAIYEPSYGPIAGVLSSVGLTFPNVLASTTYALPALMLVAVWKGLGYSTVVFLAALQGVNKDLKEAAAIDGANGWQSFWNVSFPAISPVTYFLIVTGLISTFQTFDLVNVITGGGPVNATNLYVFQLYREAFHYFRMGHASALAVVMFVAIMGFTYLQTRVAERWVHYS
jgi:sn-glycerol 3-phosphate transport system permease protein